MKAVNNERGVTLVEVLAAMAILSIILISIMNVFPQMGMLNKQNEDKAQALNTAKLLLNEWKVDTGIITALKLDSPQVGDWPEGKVPTEHIDKDGDKYYLFKIDNKNAEIKIWKEPTLDENVTTDEATSSIIEVPAHEIRINIINDKGRSLTETYGFIIVE